MLIGTCSRSSLLLMAGTQCCATVLCSALVITSWCVVARSEITDWSGQSATATPSSFVGSHSEEEASQDAEAQHRLIDHRLGEDRAAKRLLLAQEETSSLRSLTEAEQEIASLMHAALNGARSFADPYERAHALTSIAEAQTKAGDRNPALSTIAEALSAARRVREGPWRASVLATIAQAQIQVGDAEGAIWSISEAQTAASGLSDADDRASALTEIAKVQIEAGDIRSAADSISEALSAARNSLLPDFILLDVASLQAQIGNVQGALATSRLIGLTGLRELALDRIARSQAQDGDIRGALSTTWSIRDAKIRSIALSSIVEAQVEAGNIEDAISTVGSIEDTHLHVLGLSYVAKAQLRLNDSDGASQTISEASKVAKRTPEVERRISTLCIVAELQAKSGDSYSAAESIS